MSAIGTLAEVRRAAVAEWRAIREAAEARPQRVLA